MFKIGDRVSYSPKNHIATIIRVLPDNEYMVEFEDNQLIPPHMKVPGQYLLFFGTLGEVCPRCGKNWTETIIGRNTFYDCIPCKLKKEDA